MKQLLKEKTIYFNGSLGMDFNRDALGNRCSLFYIIAIIWLCCPLIAQAEQYPNTPKPILAFNDGAPSPGKPGARKTVGDIRLTIREALYYSLQGNQDIQISSYAPRQAREDLLNAQTVYDPSFNLSGTHDRNLDSESDIDSLTVNEETNFKFGVKQLLTSGGTVSLFWETLRFDKNHDPFNFEERYTSAPTIEFKQPLLKNIGARAEKAAIQIQNNNIRISEADFQQTVNDIASQVCEVYWRLYLHWKIADINRKTFDMAKEVHRREKARLADGIGKSLDVARAHSAAEARRTEIIRSRENIQLLTEQLKFLLNWADLKLDSNHRIIPIEIPQIEPIKIILAQAVKKGLENRPEIKIARKNLDTASVRKDLSRHQKLPKLDAVMSYSVNGYGRELSDSFDNIEFNDRNSWIVGLTLEMPIGNRSAKAVYRKQKLMHKQAGVAVRQLENQIRLEIKQAFWAIELAKEEIQSTLMEKTEAQNVVAGEFERFKLGQMTNEELLRAQDFLANARRNHVQAVVKYNIALSELDRAQSILPQGLEINSPEDKKNVMVSMTNREFLPE